MPLPSWGQLAEGLIQMERRPRQFVLLNTILTLCGMLKVDSVRLQFITPSGQPTPPPTVTQVPSAPGQSPESATPGSL